MPETIIRLRGLSKNFAGVHAVQAVDLDVEAGARHAVLGPNGAGKTTLFNLISGTDEPSAGTIELFGRDVTHLTGFRRARLGMARTFQSSRVLTGLSVEDNLYLAAVGSHGGHLRIFPSRTDRALRLLARETAERVALSGRLD
ncbi:MAG TPA: ATP-binding cassette domain-containing protein, partial [Candidatus Limnocylindrales bacterium]